MIRTMKTTFFALLISLGLSVGPAVAEHDKDSVLSNRMEKKLDLTAEQQKAWSEAREQMQELRTQMKTYLKSEREDFLEMVTTESKKDEPNLAKIFEFRDKMQKQFSEFRAERQDIELGFYQELSPEQKQIVFQKLQKNMEKRKDMREQRREAKNNE